MMQRDTLFNIYLDIFDAYEIRFTPFDAIKEYADNASIQLPDWYTTDFLKTARSEYIYRHAGERLISNAILKKYYVIDKTLPSPHTEEDVINTLFNEMGMILISKYMFDWSKLHDAMFADYNPIQNYDSTEEITRSGDDKTSINTDMKQTSNVSAFNSSTLQPNAEVDSSGTAANNYSKTDYNSKVKTTRYGNIGVTTSQQMIESEIELRKQNFLELIFNDVDNVFVSNLYFYKN